MKTTPEIISLTGGGAVFVDGSARARLTATLANGLSLAPTPEQERDAAIAVARQGVDAAPQWAQLSRMTEQAMAEGRNVAEQIDRAYRELKPDVFPARKTAIEEIFAQTLITRTEQVRQLLAAVRERFASPAIAAPVTAADASNLNTRISILQGAGPEEAEQLVDDAIQRDDRAFLQAARLVVPGLVQGRNSWKGAEATVVAARVMAKLDAATWTSEGAAMAYADEKAEQVADAWRFLAGKLIADHVVDDVYRATGSFSPLLDAIPATV